MNGKKKSDLTKLVLAAFVLSASLPLTGYADENPEIDQTELADQGCGARAPIDPRTGKRMTPKQHAERIAERMAENKRLEQLKQQSQGANPQQ